MEVDEESRARLPLDEFGECYLCKYVQYIPMTFL